MFKIFSFKNFDDHFHISIFGIHFCLKHKSDFEYKEAVEYGVTKDKRDPRLIVSLTSYPARINTVYKTINTLLNQTIKADEVILWLSDEQFPNLEEDLPQNLLRLKSLGLTIKWCKDFKSYKKLLPALVEYPEDIIVTADDDVYYQSDTLERLYEAYKKDSKNVYVRRSVRLELQNNKLSRVSARKYGYNCLKNASYFNQLMGGSGCLYPPHSLFKDCVNYDIVSQTVPTHDDVYFWTMAVLNNTKIQVIGGFDVDLHFVEDTQNVGLINVNKKESVGVSLEEAYGIMLQKYPQILTILKGELNG